MYSNIHTSEQMCNCKIKHARERRVGCCIKRDASGGRHSPLETTTPYGAELTHFERFVKSETDALWTVCLLDAIRVINRWVTFPLFRDSQNLLSLMFFTDENQTMPLHGNWAMWGQTNWVIASKDAYCELRGRTACPRLPCLVGGAQVYITTKNARQRLQWCITRSSRTTERWKRVVWANESWYLLGHSEERIWQLRLHGRRSNDILRVSHLGYRIVRADSSWKDLVHRSWWRLRCISAGESVLYSSSDRSFSGKMEENSRPDLLVARGKHV